MNDYLWPLSDWFGEVSLSNRSIFLKELQDHVNKENKLHTNRRKNVGLIAKYQLILFINLGWAKSSSCDIQIVVNWNYAKEKREKAENVVDWVLLWEYQKVDDPYVASFWLVVFIRIFVFLFFWNQAAA